jgi:hypothetical protein
MWNSSASESLPLFPDPAACVDSLTISAVKGDIGSDNFEALDEAGFMEPAVTDIASHHEACRYFPLPTVATGP